MLACVNCNSTKKHKDVILDRVYIPDRDNTFFAFDYTLDGKVLPSDNLTNDQKELAKSMLALVGLDKQIHEHTDANGKAVAVDRVAQRMQAFLYAERAKNRLNANPSNELREQIIETALAKGFFSIWMHTFSADHDMRQRLINAFPGTAKNCFDIDTNPITPRPPNTLNEAGKI